MVWLFAEYKGENIDVVGMDYQLNNWLVCAESHSLYSPEFIEVVLKGRGGRDVYSWCSIDVFTKYYLVVEDYFETKEENRIYLTREQAVDSAKFLGLMMEMDIERLDYY